MKYTVKAVMSVEELAKRELEMDFFYRFNHKKATVAPVAWI